jgi:hypothetical protein
MLRSSLWQAGEKLPLRPLVSLLLALSSPLGHCSILFRSAPMDFTKVLRLLRRSRAHSEPTNAQVVAAARRGPSVTVGPAWS